MRIPLFFMLYQCSRFTFMLAPQTMIEIDQYIGAVYQAVHDSRHDKGCGHIE